MPCLQIFFRLFLYLSFNNPPTVIRLNERDTCSSRLLRVGLKTRTVLFSWFPSRDVFGCEGPEKWHQVQNEITAVVRTLSSCSTTDGCLTVWNLQDSRSVEYNDKTLVSSSGEALISQMLLSIRSPIVLVITTKYNYILKEKSIAYN